MMTTAEDRRKPGTLTAIDACMAFCEYWRAPSKAWVGCSAQKALSRASAGINDT